MGLKTKNAHIYRTTEERLVGTVKDNSPLAVILPQKHGEDNVTVLQKNSKYMDGESTRQNAYN